MPAGLLIDFLPGVGKRTAKILHRMGVHTTGQLIGIPDGVLAHIFGPSIQTVLEVARSKSIPLNPTVPKTTSVSHVHDSSEIEHLSWWKKFQVAARVVSVL